MKNVWIFNHYAQEPGGPGGTRHFHLAQGLASRGWKATVFAASTELGTGRQRLDCKSLRALRHYAGVAFVWLKNPFSERSEPSRLLAMLTYTLLATTTRTSPDLRKPDVVVGSSVHLLAGFAALFLARRYKVPFIFEVRDIWPLTLLQMGRLQPESAMYRFLLALERYLYTAADKIVVLLPNAHQHICGVASGVSSEKVVWIPNGVDLSIYPAVINRKRPECDVEDGAFALMYLGSFGQANDVENMLEAMKIVQEDEDGKTIRLDLVGSGKLKGILEGLAVQLGLDNVTFERPVPKSLVPRRIATADAFIISVRDLPKLYKYGMSMNKLFDYMAAGKPIIIASGASDNPVALAGAGITVAPGSPAALADGILQLKSMSAHTRYKFGSAGRRYVEKHHSFEKLAADFGAVLDDVCL